MIINPVLITLSDNDKRMIFSLLLVIILVLVLVAFLGYLLFRIMKWQSKKMDTLVHDVVVNKIITDKKHLVRYGRIKNWALFFKQSYIPLLIMIVGGLVLIIHNSIANNWAYNPFSTVDGFGTIFWTWKLSGEFSGSSTDLIRFQIIVLDNTPHLVAEAWAGYVACPLLLVGGAWYLISASCLLSRTFLLYKRSREVFEKSLEGFNQNETIKQESNDNSNQANPE